MKDKFWLLETIRSGNLASGSKPLLVKIVVAQTQIQSFSIAETIQPSSNA
jgi:hypothetical protein